jgi:hypothetical protein
VRCREALDVGDAVGRLCDQLGSRAVP